eukprot:9477222-Pyramimonas_sp.AAC.1
MAPTRRRGSKGGEWSGGAKEQPQALDWERPRQATPPRRCGTGLLCDDHHTAGSWRLGDDGDAPPSPSSASSPASSSASSASSASS